MEWVRGQSLGSGSFATVNLVIPTNGSTSTPPTAVKSSNVHTSYLLKNEEHVLNRIGCCPQIINCFGHDQTLENGEEYYNLFLEYASGGTLADQLKNHGGRFPESLARRYTRSIVEGLKHIHANGFVHCDVKPQNILVFDNGDVKIADFGLAKETGEKEKQSQRWEFRGTPMFMSPESVNDNEYESPADIWALGCAVVEMVTGKPAWNVRIGSNIWSLLIRIGVGEELPLIPDEMSNQGKNFLEKCFVKDPKKRWSAEMLLKHPFLADDTVSFNDSLPSSSPRTHFDFPHWASTLTASPDSDEWREFVPLPGNRIRRLVTDQGPMDWSESDSWTNGVDIAEYTIWALARKTHIICRLGGFFKLQKPIMLNLNSRLARVGASIVKQLCTGNYISMCRAGYVRSARNHYLQPSFQEHSFTKLYKGAIIEKHNFLSTTATNNTTEDGSEEKEMISVTFIDKDGEEKLIKVPVGMSMLEAAHENDIELEGACEGSLACSTCHVIVMDVEYYNKLEDPTDEENDMLDLAFGLTETSRLGCQVIAKPELDGIRLAIPAATRNFAVDGYVPKPH
ncbi:Serine/threonine-protein kinase, active site [Sesbania bispinosa]|nr:Serine/threonine-protein kinase, active site [Sesbania bispinosa]